MALQRTPHLHCKHAIHSSQGKSNFLDNKDSQPADELHAGNPFKVLERREGRGSHAGISGLLEQLEHPFQQGVGLLSLSLVPLPSPVLKSLQQLAN